MDNPITGVGPGRYGAESVDYVRDNPIVIHNPVGHNAYLEILAENGPFALAAFLAFLGGSWVMLSRQRRASEARGKPGRVHGSPTRYRPRFWSRSWAPCSSASSSRFPFWLIGALAAVAPRVLGRNEAPAAGYIRESSLRLGPPRARRARRAHGLARGCDGGRGRRRRRRVRERRGGGAFSRRGSRRRGDPAPSIVGRAGREQGSGDMCAAPTSSTPRIDAAACG